MDILENPAKNVFNLSAEKMVTAVPFKFVLKAFA
jgi:hypothetical protein